MNPAPSTATPARPLLVPGALLHPITSLVERLDLESLFVRPQPVEMEIGAGDGSFLLAYAQGHPERNFLGVERLLGRLRKIDRRGQRLGLRNLLGVRIEATYLVEYLLPPSSVTALHIYFPDPWPKRRHWDRRVVNDRFTTLAAQVLAPGGKVYLRTDDVSYFTQMQTVFSRAAAFSPGETPAELAATLTDFERHFNARGVPTLRAAFHRADGA